MADIQTRVAPARMASLCPSALLKAGASLLSLTCVAAPALAQDPVAATEETTDENAIVVTGIRASLERAMDIKRDATGVVDAISAEDIGKFPDTSGIL